jgi:hypothetical protein
VLALGLFAASSLPGCFISADSNPPAPIGTLTLEWTVAGTTDPAACDSFEVDGFDLIIYDDRGVQVTEVTAPCDAFNVSVDLEEGTYSVDATLTDRGLVGSVTESLDNLDVIGGTELTASVDFPPVAFLP